MMHAILIFQKRDCSAPSSIFDITSSSEIRGLSPLLILTIFCLFSPIMVISFPFCLRKMLETPFKFVSVADSIRSCSKSSFRFLPFLSDSTAISPDGIARLEVRPVESNPRCAPIVTISPFSNSSVMYDLTSVYLGERVDVPDRLLLSLTRTPIEPFPFCTSSTVAGVAGFENDSQQGGHETDSIGHRRF